MTTPPSPEIDQPTSAQVGVDEWVARSGHRREYAPGWRGDAQRLFERVGWWQRLGVAAFLGLLVPFFTVNDFQLQVGINALLLALLALGLNVAVGWAGLLDLGYIAFYGFGAYGFALLSSDQLNSPTGIHLPALVSVPIVMVAAAVLGLVVGLPSRRLIGDYLAIITLFFGEAFVEFTNNVAPSKLGGPNGITGVDPYKLPVVGSLTTNKQYFWLLLALLVISMAVLHLLDTSRTGRAWRAVREDPLAAEHDDDPGQPGEADGVQLRRGRRGARRDGVRRAADQRVPDGLRHAVSDPHLRGAHPRRRRQHRRRRARRSDRLDHARRLPAQSDRIRLSVLRNHPLHARGQGASLAQARRDRRRHGGVRIRDARDRQGDLRECGRGRPAVKRMDRRRRPGLGRRTVEPQDRGQHRLRRR